MLVFILKAESPNLSKSRSKCIPGYIKPCSCGLMNTFDLASFPVKEAETKTQVYIIYERAVSKEEISEVG